MEIKNFSHLGNALGNLLTAISPTMEAYTLPMETMNDEAKEGYKEFADLSQVLLAGYRSHGNGNNVAMFHLKNGQVVVLFESQKKKTIRGTYDNPKHCYDCRMAIVRHLVM